MKDTLQLRMTIYFFSLSVFMCFLSITNRNRINTSTSKIINEIEALKEKAGTTHIQHEYIHHISSEQDNGAYYDGKDWGTIYVDPIDSVVRPNNDMDTIDYISINDSLCH